MVPCFANRVPLILHKRLCNPRDSVDVFYISISEKPVSLGDTLSSVVLCLSIGFSTLHLFFNSVAP